MKRALRLGMVGGVLAASALWSASVSAQAVPGQPIPTPLNVSASVTGTFGAASVLSESEYTQTDYFLISSGLSATYLINDEHTLSLSGGFSQYATRTGGINDVYEFRWQDTYLSWSMFPLYVEENTGIIFIAGAGVTLPTSDLSLAEGLYFSPDVSITALKPFGGMILVYAFGLSKNFHEYTSQVFDANELDVIARDGGAEQVTADRIAEPGVLTSFGMTNSFVLIYNAKPWFQFRTGLTYSDSWSYDNGTISEEDALTSPNAVVGRGHRQNVSGNFGVRFLVAGDSFFGRGLQVRLGANTSGPPLTSDNNGVRFPFWDFENGQSTRTTLSLGLSGTY